MIPIRDDIQTGQDSVINWMMIIFILGFTLTFVILQAGLIFLVQARLAWIMIEVAPALLPVL
jgi:hypothetical protein